ncbi:MAG: FkbM family methyltransferase [Ignavibacteria bacterium]|nr:FkbM family methyltransferase [Ignavibacteria bacterium]MBI3766538.1 FkbM family methyltransferase [Ignavibacteriales bacterium]
MGLKTVLKRRLPKAAVTAIKKIRYARKISSVNEESEVDFRAIKYLVSRGNHVIDLGANMGFYTKYLSDLVGPTGKVYSIEPIPSSFGLLNYIVQKLHLQNVHLFNYAISSSAGEVRMEVPVLDSGEENLFEAKITPNQSTSTARTVIVPSRTLDSIISLEKRKIAFIKCDVEGHELECLKGAVSIIQHSKPSWLVEIWGDLDEQDSKAHQTVEFFSQLGYFSYWFDGIHFQKRQQGERSVNYFFLTADHLRALEENHILSPDGNLHLITEKGI